MKRDNYPLLQSLNILRRKLEQDVVGHLPTVVSFIHMELRKALEGSSGAQENEVIDSIYQQALVLVKDALLKRLSTSESQADNEKVYKAVFLNFLLDDLKFASFWYPVWSIVAKYFAKNAQLISPLEACIVARVESGCIDFRGKSGDALSLGRIVLLLLRLLGKNAKELLGQESISRLLTAASSLHLEANIEAEALSIAVSDLRSAVQSEAPVEYPSSFLSAQELLFKLFPFVIYFNSLGKMERQELAGALLLDTIHVKTTRLLLAAILARTSGPCVLVAAHTLLDQNCLFKSTNIARLLPLSLCTNELVSRVRFLPFSSLGPSLVPFAFGLYKSRLC